jgi:hypothetical protein
MAFLATMREFALMICQTFLKPPHYTRMRCIPYLPKQNPHVIFCSTQECFESFGFKKAAAMSVSSLGIVISPRGWDGHFVRHEMIHHRQAEELGLLSGILKPEWLIEGMAYSLSFDPRMQLADQWQNDRIKFEAWYQKIGKKQLWKQASKL